MVAAKKCVRLCVPPRCHDVSYYCTDVLLSVQPLASEIPYVAQIDKMPGMQAKKTQVINAAFSREGGKLVMTNGDAAIYTEVLCCSVANFTALCTEPPALLCSASPPWNVAWVLAGWSIVCCAATLIDPHDFLMLESSWVCVCVLGLLASYFLGCVLNLAKIVRYSACARVSTTTRLGTATSLRWLARCVVVMKVWVLCCMAWLGPPCTTPLSIMQTWCVAVWFVWRKSRHGHNVACIWARKLQILAVLEPGLWVSCCSAS